MSDKLTMQDVAEMQERLWDQREARRRRVQSLQPAIRRRGSQYDIALIYIEPEHFRRIISNHINEFGMGEEPIFWTRTRDACYFFPKATSEFQIVWEG